MIKKASVEDFTAIYKTINDSASAYKGVIPEDRWHEPYMPEEELREQIADGVVFYCYHDGDQITGVMGIQDRGDVNLIRHAYVLTSQRGNGIGGLLLQHLMGISSKPILIGTWKAASWAVSFYCKHGFNLVTEMEKNTLLKKYWNIPDRQIETSVVLADSNWRTE